MKKIFYLFVCVLFCTSGFGKPVDFSGTWNLNKPLSTLNEQFSMAAGKTILKQTVDSLTVEKHVSFQDQNFTLIDRLTLDGKECINDGWRDTKKKSTISWSEDEKNMTVTSKIPMQNGGEMLITETYQMEGDHLKIAVKATSSFGELSEIYIFDKQ